MLQVIQVKLKHRGPNSRILEQQQRLQKELYRLKYPETKEAVSAHRAHQMYQRSEVCSKQMFMPYKKQAQKAWVNEMKVAEWREGSEPNFSGTTNHTTQKKYS